MEWLAGLIGAVVAALGLIIGNLLTTGANARSEKQRLDAEERRLRMQLEAERTRAAEDRLFQHRLDAIAATNAAFLGVVTPAFRVGMPSEDPDADERHYRTADRELSDAVGSVVTVFPEQVESKAVALQKAIHDLHDAEGVAKIAARTKTVSARNDFVRAARDVLLSERRDQESQPG